MITNRAFASLALATLLSTLAPSVFADELPAPAVSTPAPETTRSEWYGWQVITADGIATGLLFGGAAIGGSNGNGRVGLSVATIGAGGYLFAAPAIHVAHKNVGRAFGSLGMRMGIPVITGFIGAAAAGKCGDGDGLIGLCGLAGAALGVGAGMLTAMVIDAAALSWETAKPLQRLEPKASLVPDIMVSPRGAQAGLSGRF